MLSHFSKSPSWQHKARGGIRNASGLHVDSRSCLLTLRSNVGVQSQPDVFEPNPSADVAPSQLKDGQISRCCAGHEARLPNLLISASFTQEDTLCVPPVTGGASLVDACDC